ncbi:MutT/nudix family protein [Caulobacter phage C1]|nr:MutT/nudix family protein [Caulobacter phage C1]UTU08539.1 MutT/nudix family protein [Caulobacter phage C2]UTU09055.1 MutT/nudix family protein [Caulobacter phage J4]UTU09614.1 MutT/nudix family protein [Caulobacter phage BL47]UTU10172.1 MutT/nudix family protein [Caulobacter phage RB23]WGN97206.1 MutT/nudix family protein [Bertelyvirus sp.]
MYPKHHLILHGIEDAGMQGMVRAILGPDYSSIIVSENMIHQEWNNPKAVAVLLQPVYDDENDRLGVIVGKRAIAPQIGEWAIPGGFVQNFGRSIEEEAVTEFEQEMGIAGLTADTVRMWHSYPTPNGRILFFCVNGQTLKAREIKEVLGAGKGDGEMSDFKVAYEPFQLAFPFHTIVMEKFFRSFQAGAKEFPMPGYGLIASRGHLPQR